MASTTNDAQVYTLPLQRAIDFAIAQVNSTEADQSSTTVSEFPFTQTTNEEQEREVQEGYMQRIESILCIAFFIAMIGVIYHLAGLVATEREIGMAQLLDVMMPNNARWLPQAARLLSHNIAFALVYVPGWIAMGAVMGGMAFKATSIIIPIVSHILCGLSLASLGLFAGCCFRKSQLSGITAVILSLGLAIIAMACGDIATGWVAVLSLLFPPMNYMYHLILIARWETQSRGASLTAGAPNSNSTVPVLAFWVFAIIQMVLYLAIGALIERWAWGATSSRRKTGIPGSPVAVSLTGFTKTYQPSVAQRFMSLFTKKKTKPFTAVGDLNLDAFRGETMVLLGANGSGKSTTLDAVAGLHSATSGEIVVSYAQSGGRFGHCPQKNVMWDELTVEEHVRIFDGIKSISKRSSKEALKELVEACDLTKKASSAAGTLSGGQKRKLQLAMMFVGDSTVCCVDEVSSGVDPLSRRKLWDILLRDSGWRTVILTTHYLDEADFLADRIAILSHGRLKANGTSVELKQSLGMGYKVQVPRAQQSGPHRVFQDQLHAEHENETVYLTGSPGETHQFMRRLEAHGQTDYHLDGPTLEDVFLKLASEDALNAGILDEEEFQNARPRTAGSTSPLGYDSYQARQKQDGTPDILNGRKTGLLAQIWILLNKRFTLFRRGLTTYLIAVVIPIIAAGCCSIFLQGVEVASCNPDRGTSGSDSDPATSPQYWRFIAGPESQISEDLFESILRVKPESVTFVDSISQFNDQVQADVSNLTGGIFLGDEPTFAWRAEQSPIFAHAAQNIINNALLDTDISSTYEPLMIPFTGDTGDLIIFTTICGLAMAIYPAFLGLYPIYERRKGIRRMHYSNGIRAFPLWVAYLAFDFTLTVFISTVAIIIFAAVTGVWYHLEYLFAIFLLYGVASTLFFYVLSLLVSSQLAVFATGAVVQALAYLIFFVSNMGTFTYTDPSSLTSTLNIIFFSIGMVSPVFSLTRSLYLSVNMFGIACRDESLVSYPGTIDVYGGPILYLILQSLIFFGFLLWKESGFNFSSLHRRVSPKHLNNEVAMEMASPLGSYGNSVQARQCLEAIHLQKDFKKFTAVEDVNFAVPQSGCFALLGPNGAGKTTCISMIQGDVPPSSRETEILVDGVSVIRNREEARSRIGVCPQIDPLDNMTVGEHLRFYAEVRGIRDPTYNVNTLLRCLGLEEFVDRIATKLSGGNKRKLSLGIALMGNPTVLLLDEPSSGMDALSKRLMWRTLASVTPGRALLLTTHSMEEANALASHVGIVAKRMLTQGTTGELKARYGAGYVAHLVHRDAPHSRVEDMEAIWTWVQRCFPTTGNVDRVQHGQVRFEIPLGSEGGNRTLADVMETIEIAKQRLGIRYYDISRATLDQVFFKVVGTNEREDDE